MKRDCVIGNHHLHRVEIVPSKLEEYACGEIRVIHATIIYKCCECNYKKVSKVLPPGKIDRL